ncbi:MAG: tRNA (guanosine(46)-N7)-methyltransferase TrmB [Flavobacteriales bacterium]
MGKGKLEKFEEISAFDNVLEPDIGALFQEGHRLKGKWREELFPHDGPLYLELACGKGEYAVELGQRYPDANFLGIDIKGNRIWNGAKRALEEGLENVRFLRTRVEFLEAFFEAGEVDGIWITFPDPQTKQRRAKKRLTAPLFLDRYRRILKRGAELHLKTDNGTLYTSTREVLKERGERVERDMADLYKAWEKLSEEEQKCLMIRTFYEEMALREGASIKYLRFRLL